MFFVSRELAREPGINEFSWTNNRVVLGLLTIPQFFCQNFDMIDYEWLIIIYA